MAAISTLIDAFNLTSLQTGLWTQFTGGSATMGYTGNGVVMSYPESCTSSTDGDIASNTTYDLTGSSIYLQVLQVPRSGTSADAEFRLKVDASNFYRFVYEGGTLFFQKQIATVTATVASIAYNSISHAFWRLRESGGTVFWDTSPDGLEGNWTNQTTFINVLTITSLTVLIAGTCFQVETGPGQFIFKNLNTRRSKGPSYESPHISTGDGVSRAEVAN